jgi:hypothetical protein
MIDKLDFDELNILTVNKLNSSHMKFCFREIEGRIDGRGKCTSFKYFM